LSIRKELFQKGKDYYQTKNYDQAIQYYKRITFLYPNSIKAWNNLGICYVKIEDYPNAIQSFENAIKIDNQNLSLWNNLGKVYYHKHDYDHVIETYEKANKFFPDSDFFWNGIGMVYNHLGDFDNAINAFKSALDKNSKSKSAWNNLCLAYTKKGVDFDPNAFKPNTEVSWYHLSKALLISGLYKDSLDAINRSISLNPSFNTAFTFKSKIKDIIRKYERIKAQQINIEVNNESNVEDDKDFERFKKLQAKKKKDSSKNSDAKSLSLEARFKFQQEKFRRRLMEIEDSTDSKEVSPSQNYQTLSHQTTQKSKSPHKIRFVNIHANYHKIEDCNFVVDGANIARDMSGSTKKGSISNLFKLFEKLNNLELDNYVVICDRSLYYTIDNQHEYSNLLKKGKIIETPGGTEADHFILKYAKENNSFIISNDLFREFREIYGKKWINERRITFKFIKDKLYFDKIYTAS